MILLIFFWFLNVSIIQSRLDSRIIGGENAYESQFPFAAAINVQTRDSRFFCGGALMSSDWVLTAGLCAYNATLFTIQLGSTTLTNQDPERVTVASSEYVLHPNFDPETIENDLALIKLRIPIEFTDYIKPIYLPTVDLYNYTSVTVLGWGQTNDSSSALSENLKFARVSVISNVECKLIYGDQISDNMACVQGNYNEGTCTGDNGGALIEYLSRYYWIVGIASFVSSNGCESTDPSGYTRTFPYTEWLNSYLYPIASSSAKFH